MKKQITYFSKNVTLIMYRIALFTMIAITPYNTLQTSGNSAIPSAPPPPGSFVTSPGISSTPGAPPASGTPPPPGTPATSPSIPSTPGTPPAAPGTPPDPSTPSASDTPASDTTYVDKSQLAQPVNFGSPFLVNQTKKDITITNIKVEYNQTQNGKITAAAPIVTKAKIQIDSNEGLQINLSLSIPIVPGSNISAISPIGISEIEINNTDVITIDPAWLPYTDNDPTRCITFNATTKKYELSSSDCLKPDKVKNATTSKTPGKKGKSLKRADSSKTSPAS